MTSEESGKVAELLKGQRIAMLTTTDADGTLISRPMAVQEVEFDGDLWFFAERTSRTVTHIGGSPQVDVTVGSGSSRVSLTGSARVVDDPAKKRELWNGAVEAWFPDGPDDDDVVLLKVDAESAEYWDTPGGRLATVLSFATSRITGQPYSGGENEAVRL
jgi:general stress protein 26